MFFIFSCELSGLRLLYCFLGLHGFTLDPSIGEFILTHPNVQIPKRGDVYSINEAYSPEWPSGLQQYISDVKRGHGESKTRFSSRYIGSFVGDFHRTLLNGGVFAYPPNYKYPGGKLVYLHEVAPLAFLMEQAGGRASTGTSRILDIIPKSLTEHVPVFMGSFDDVLEVEKYVSKN